VAPKPIHYLSISNADPRFDPFREESSPLCARQHTSDAILYTHHPQEASAPAPQAQVNLRNGYLFYKCFTRGIL
jgi:hypothetical protein